MTIFTIIVIAFGLAMDAFAVSVANGAIMKKLHIPHALRIALAFGFFQGIMPIIGWLAGNRIQNTIQAFDHWLVFGLLFFVGIKMIYEAFAIPDQEKNSTSINTGTLLLLSIATSLDALAIGLSFSLIQIRIIIPAIIIAVVTFILSFLGVLLGNKIGSFFTKKIEAFGGIILILIGFKILIEHLIPISN